MLGTFAQPSPRAINVEACSFEVRFGVFDFDGQKRALELAGMLRPQ